MLGPIYIYVDGNIGPIIIYFRESLSLYRCVSSYIYIYIYIEILEEGPPTWRPLEQLTSSETLFSKPIRSPQASVRYPNGHICLDFTGLKPNVHIFFDFLASKSKVVNLFGFHVFEILGPKLFGLYVCQSLGPRLGQICLDLMCWAKFVWILCV